MLAAEIWHWWIGIVLVGVGILSVLGLAAQYLKNVTAKQYPAISMITDRIPAPTRTTPIHQCQISAASMQPRLAIAA